MGPPRKKVCSAEVFRDNMTKQSRNRGYALKKIQENNEAEIMEVVADEARSSYPAEIVVELKSEGTEDLEANVARIIEWIKAWREQHASDGTES